ncbi:ATP-binding cassette sub-family G member 2 [Schistosoma japonicum]|nr:ATP-binding cassette sub-family G member 2 [Schistosoma japonicum]KAH8875585.1 ATP-binding cassette sub-family G member 2 [Schistosoma japonicum]
MTRYINIGTINDSDDLKMTLPITMMSVNHHDTNININDNVNTNNNDNVTDETLKLPKEYYTNKTTQKFHQPFQKELSEFTCLPQIIEHMNHLRNDFDNKNASFVSDKGNAKFCQYENNREIHSQQYDTIQRVNKTPRDLRSHQSYPRQLINSNSPQPLDSSQITSPDDNQFNISMPTHSSNISKFLDNNSFRNYSAAHTSLPVATDQSFGAFKILNNQLDHSSIHSEGHMKYRSFHDTMRDGNIPYARMNSLKDTDNTSNNGIQPINNSEKSYIDQSNSSISKKQSLTNLGEYPPAPGSSSSQRGKISGATLSFHHITYEVKIKKTLCSKPIIKTILNDVSGILRPGMNALMGPTGCGKSSLLDVLAGRKDPKFLSGKVLVDGRPQPKNFKCISGYVVQDDIVMGTLTVRENLSFSAALRMTVHCTTEERNQKVNDIIDELGLNAVADSKVGTELVRGVSGGERKRTSIGMELITEPPVLFLDEPTTGLDAYMAGQVLKTLKALSRRGRTIIFSIHQPKYSIYKLFDSLTLIYRGQIVYHGPARKEPIRYFDRLGYICENHNNPPDFFMDVIHGECLRQQGNVTDGQIISHHDTQERMHLVGQQLIHDWQNSDMAQHVLEEVSSITNRLEEYENGPKKSKDKGVDISFAVPFCRQINRVCWRSILNLLRDPLASVIQTVVYLFFALSMGIVYFQMNDSLESGIQNRTGLFYFCTLQVIFVNLATIELFIKERILFIHESSSGFYQVSVYFFSKILCDILPTKVLPILLFMPICYWMAGLQRTFKAFMFFELLLCLSTSAAAAIALFISASVTVFGLANAILSIIYVFMMAFSGFLINLKSMGAWLSWLRYLSIFRYSMGGLLAMEMTTLQFCPMDKSNTTINRQCQNGTTYLEDQQIPYKTTWDLSYNVVGLLAIMIIFYILCYIQLRLLNKYK